MVDVVKRFQNCSFREIEFPIENLEFGFSHDSSEHKFLFRDDPLIQGLGRKALTWKVTIPLSENIAKGTWKDLYTVTFPELLNACRDREVGVFEAPDLGAYPALCASFSYSIDPANMRDGVRVSVEFVHAPAEGDSDDIAPLIPSLDGAVSLAGALNRVVDSVDWKQEGPGIAETDPLTALTGVFDQVSAARNKVKGKMDAAIYKVQKLNKSLDKVSAAKNWSVRRQNNDLHLALIETKNSVGAAGKSVKEHTTTVAISLIALADSLKMPLQKFIALNGQLAKLAVVPPNTVVRYTVG